MGYLICKLHGASGSGKTTTARALMAFWGEVQFKDDFLDVRGKRIKYAHVLRTDKPDLYLIGDYSRPGCGGADTISSYETTMTMVDRFHDKGHVLYEGLLLSTYYGAPGKWSEKWGDDHLFAFLDTPATLCVERVEQRRAEMGSKNKFNPQQTIAKHATIERLYHKLGVIGRRTVLLRHDDSPAHDLKKIYESHI